MTINQLKLFLTLILISFFVPSIVTGGEIAKKQPCCTGQTYFVVICPGDTICSLENGDYNFPAEECDKPLKVTAKNIDDFAGNLSLKDPPCNDTKNCKRISVLDSSGIPAKNTACRFREKVAVCKAK